MLRCSVHTMYRECWVRDIFMIKHDFNSFNKLQRNTWTLKLCTDWLQGALPCLQQCHQVQSKYSFCNINQSDVKVDRKLVEIHISKLNTAVIHANFHVYEHRSKLVYEIAAGLAQQLTYAIWLQNTSCIHFAIIVRLHALYDCKIVYITHVCAMLQYYATSIQHSIYHF